MKLQIASINSGSNGNCYYIGNDEEAVLIDAGVACRETERRLRDLDLDIKKIKAVFISHEHKDHISGVAVLSKRYQWPVYITQKTLRNCRPGIEKHLIRFFTSDEEISLGSITIRAFSKFHDAHDPHSFIIQCETNCVGVFTDIGRVCKNVILHFRKCHAVFLESNYDEDMLAKGNYPLHLKRRITNGDGHLSNNQALQLFCEHKWAGLKLLILSHLSANNNKEETVQELFSKHAGNTEIFVASRYRPSPVFVINEKFLRDENRKMQQLTLF
ncbi:MAG: MBL fold metallo-hydrolase [Bacteroidetes bacterium]|nr:MBL fold metallo-hydrolase [Bacteroidota bacterium]